MKMLYKNFSRKCVIFASTIIPHNTVVVLNLLLHCESLVPFSDTLQPPYMKSILDDLEHCFKSGVSGPKCWLQNVFLVVARFPRKYFYVFHPSQVH